MAQVIHAKAFIFGLSINWIRIGFVLGEIGFVFGFIGFELGLNWVCFL
jgi:hypothetical protein